MDSKANACVKRRYWSDQNVIINFFLILNEILVVESTVSFETLSETSCRLVTLRGLGHYQGASGDDDEHVGEFFVGKMLRGCLLEVELAKFDWAHVIVLGCLILSTEIHVVVELVQFFQIVVKDVTILLGVG